MLVSLEHKFALFHTPKCGGVSLSKALEKYADLNIFRNDLKGSESLNKLTNKHSYGFSKANDILIWRSHATLEQSLQIAPELESPEIRKIAFVRNVYDRIYSAYIQQGFDLKYRYPESDALRIKFASVDFNEFVQTELEENRATYDIRWMHYIPMHKFSHINGINCMFFVGRHEFFDEDSNRVFDLLNLPSSTIEKRNMSTPPKTVLNPSNMQKSEYKYLHKYERRTIELINEIYEKDFLFFDYKRILPSEIPSSLN